jgi:undecaprenyl diphosphate synthase
MRQSTLTVPAHVAIIMDGNGRWAEARGCPRTVGHVAGARTVRDIVAHAARVGIAQLTLYAFSSDNWQRPLTEVHALLALFTEQCQKQTQALVNAGIRLTVIGRRDRLPASLLRAIALAERVTADQTRMHLRVAVDYSSRDAIRAAHTGEGAANAIATQSPLLPAVDLLIRTGGERRLSDFLLWECAYAELAFLDVFWPAMTPAMLDDTLADFAHRDRRFGGVAHRVSA